MRCSLPNSQAGFFTRSLRMVAILSLILTVVVGVAEAREVRWVNVAPFATLKSNPYCGTLSYLTDGEIPPARGVKLAQKGPFLEDIEVSSNGSISQNCQFPIKTLAPASITFTFSAPVTVKGVRFMQAGSLCTSFRIEADINGNGLFEAVIAISKTDIPLPTVKAEFKPVRVRAIRFTMLKTQKRIPLLGEFQIIGNETEALKLKNVYAPVIGPDELLFGKPVKTPVKRQPPDKRFQFGVTSSMWMWINITEPYAKHGLNKAALARMKELDMDRVRCFIGLKPKDQSKITIPENPRYSASMKEVKADKSFYYFPLPSKVFAGYEENILKRLSDDLKKEGYEFVPIPPRNVPPFDTRSGHYPMAQSDHHGEYNPKFPCATNGEFYKNAFSTILQELAASGVTGVDIVPDEFYIENHNLKRMCADDPCRALFRKQYGLDVPTKVEDTETYRKWLLFQMESTARLFKVFSDAAKKAAPGVVTESNFSVVPLLFFNRPGFGLAIDLVGHTGAVDVLGTDPYFRLDTLGHYQMPKTACIYKGATPNRTVCMMLQAVAGDFLTPLTDPVWTAGNATSMIMRGVRNIDLYRFNYFANIRKVNGTHPTTPIYKNWIAMIRRLEAFGLKKARIPRKIAFIYNRAGEDWWELREKLKTPNPYDYPQSAMAGHIHHDATMRMLFANGHPFEAFFLDQPSTLSNVSGFKVMIIPFAYSISDKAKAVIQDAVDAGVKLLVLKGRGETDEYGTLRKTPALAGFERRKGVIMLDENLLTRGNDIEVEKKILSALWALLGADRPIIVNNYRRDIEVGMLESENGTKFIFAVNWDKRDSVLDLGLNLPRGAYTVDRFDLEGVSVATLAGKRKTNERALMRFRVNIKGHETLALVVRKSE